MSRYRPHGMQDLVCCIVEQAVRDVRASNGYAREAWQFLQTDNWVMALDVSQETATRIRGRITQPKGATMNPVEQAMLDYHHYLRAGGTRPRLDEKYPYEPHEPARMVNTSDLLGCDRQACYKAMCDIGEIERDFENPDQLELLFRVGNIFEDYVAEAVEHARALVGWQRRISAGNRKGRTDLIVDPTKLGLTYHGELWVVEVKSTKDYPSKTLAERTPYNHHIAQADWYAARLREQEPSGPHYKPVLLYVVKSSMETILYSWEWDGGDCILLTWDPLFGFETTKTIRDLAFKIKASDTAQTAWIAGGELPPRVVDDPEKHPYLCVKKDWKKTKMATPNCNFFGRCWETDNLDPFPLGSWKAR